MYKVYSILTSLVLSVVTTPRTLHPTPFKSCIFFLASVFQLLPLLLPSTFFVQSAKALFQCYSDDPMKRYLLSTPVLFLEVVCFSLVFLSHVLLQLLFLVPLRVDPVSQEILPENRARSETTSLVTNRWNRRFLLNFLENFLHSLFTILFSLKCSPLLPQCWATHILEHWDDCNTHINIGEGETHTGVSRFLTSIANMFLLWTTIKAKDTGFDSLNICWFNNYQQCWGVIAEIKSIWFSISYSHSWAFNMFNGPIQHTMWHDTLFKNWWTKAAKFTFNHELTSQFLCNVWKVGFLDKYYHDDDDDDDDNDYYYYYHHHFFNNKKSLFNTHKKVPMYSALLKKIVKRNLYFSIC